MNSAGVVWNLARGRAPRADDSAVQQVVDRLDRAAVGVVVASSVALLTLLRVLVDLRWGRPDRVGATAAMVLLVVALLVAVVRRRALATARRIGHPPRRTWA